jgi:NAD(P)-dependent dehydrogenase (short-subunit alcohol dehydrogenase family)
MKILVTGCSTGIGRAAAAELAARGHHVIATARRPETLADLDVTTRLALDVDSDASIAAALGAVGGAREIDVLVNNAGLGVSGPVEKVPLDEVRRMFETNFFGAVRMMQAVLPDMRTRGSGVVVNVTSVAGIVAAPLSGFYSATKYALEAVTEAARLELGHFGVRVLAVEPGYIETSFGDNSASYGEDVAPYDELAAVWEKAQGVIEGANGQPQTPELVARVIADAIETDDRRLHVPAGTDADMIIATRESMDYATFEATMRQMLEIDW